MNPDVYIHFQLARGNLLAAETALEEMLKSSPEDSNAHANLALVKLQQGFKDEARRSVSLALKFGAGNAFAHFVHSHVRLADLRMIAIPLLGTSPEDGFGVRKAISDVQEAIRLDSHEPIYLLRLGELQALLGRWKLALAAADAALVLDPESVTAGIARADALNRLRRKGEARETLCRTLAANPEASEAHSGLGWALLESGERVRAVQFFEVALRLNPNSPWAQEGLFECGKRNFVVYRCLAGVRSWLNSQKVWVRITSVGIPFAAFIGGLGWLSELAKRQPQFKWIPASLFWAALVLMLFVVFADALFGWFARREKAGQSTYAEEERQLEYRHFYLVLFGVAGAVFAIVVGKFSRELLWGAMGLVPGVYGIWIVRKIRQAAARKWAWFYACMVLLAGVPVALWLEARVLRMPNWGLLLAMLGPILPLALLQEITAQRQRTAEHESAKARLRQGTDSHPMEQD